MNDNVKIWWKFQETTVIVFKLHQNIIFFFVLTNINLKVDKDNFQF